MTCQAVVVTSVEVLAIPPVDGEVRVTLLADQSGLPGEELPVSNDAPAGQLHPPFPRTVHAIDESAAAGSKFFDGEVGDGTGKEGKKSYFLD